MADHDRNWLKNPILPPPPALPRFSAAELRLVNDERPSVRRAAPRKSRALKVEPVAQAEGRPARVTGVDARRRSHEVTRESESEAPRSRRIA